MFVRRPPPDRDARRAVRRITLPVVFDISQIEPAAFLQLVDGASYLLLVDGSSRIQLVSN